MSDRMLFDPSAPLAPNAPTAVACGTLTLTLEQARRVLGHLGHLDLDPVHEGTTWASLLLHAFAANLATHQNEPADVEFPRHAYGPILVFTGGSVEWQSSFTRGRTVTLSPAATGGVRMTWFSGIGGMRSRLIGCILFAIDRQPFIPKPRAAKLNQQGATMPEDLEQLPPTRPDGAPAWAFFWDSNPINGWVASEEDFRILVRVLELWAAINGGPVPTLTTDDRRHPLQAKRFDGVDFHGFGFRFEHRGETLRTHAERNGLDWMLR